MSLVNLPLRSAPRALPALALALAAPACAGGDAPGAGGVPPSILLVSIDTLRADHVGVYGYERDTTPYLDRLAEECLVFDRAYTTAPWTLVAHMSMMSGLEPTEHGVVDAKKAAAPEVPLVAERLRDAGYRTLGFYFGDWLGPRYGFDRGFDVYEQHRRAAEAGRHLRRALDGHNPERPLFLFLHLFDVHTAPFEPGFHGFYDPPAPYDELFLPGARGRLAGVDCRAVWDHDAALTEPQIEAMTALYDGGVRYVDAWLEERIEGWRESGLLERSLLIVTADHGESLGQHDLYGAHGGMYEEGLRVPLLVRFPDGFRAGEREAGVVSLVDLAPTILAAAGLEPEPWRSGRSLRAPPPPERVVRAERNRMTALIGREWKLIRSEAGGRAYHLPSDAAERDPRTASDPAARAAVAELRRRAAADRDARPAPPGAARDLRALGAAAREELADLGYAAEVGGEEPEAAAERPGGD